MAEDDDAAGDRIDDDATASSDRIDDNASASGDRIDNGATGNPVGDDADDDAVGDRADGRDFTTTSEGIVKEALSWKVTKFQRKKSVKRICISNDIEYNTNYSNSKPLTFQKT